MADQEAAIQAVAEATESQAETTEAKVEETGGGYLSQSRAAVQRAIERAEAEAASKEQPAEPEPAVEAAPEPEAEAKPEVKPEPKEAEVDHSVAQREFERREAALRKYESDLKARDKRMEELKRSDPLAFLRENGIDFNDVAQRILNDGSPGPEELAKKEKEHIKSLEQRIEQLQSYIQQKDIEQKRQAYIQEAESLVGEEDAWLRKYSRLTGVDVGSLALNVMTEYYGTHGKPLTAAQALDMIKQDLRPVWEETVGAPPPPVAPPPPERPTGQTQPPKPKPATLSNDLTNQSLDDGLEGLSWEERKEKLAAALQWNE